jgi:dihydroorotate dehydrogenase (fumarate)
VVLHSLFEEQIERDQLELWRVSIQGSNSYGESLDYFPEPSLFHVGHDLYLRHIEQARAHLSIPLIASLNGVRPGDWVKVARS